MTGLHVGILRDGRWQTLDISELTDAELDKLVHDKTYGHATWEQSVGACRQAWAHVRNLARWVRDNVPAAKK